jgi:hypothetical protein
MRRDATYLGPEFRRASALGSQDLSRSGDFLRETFCSRGCVCVDLGLLVELE